MEIKAKYNSVWDGGFTITTNCVINLLTGVIDIETTSDTESAEVEILDREYVDLNEHEFDVIEDDRGNYCIADPSALKMFISGVLDETATNATNVDRGLFLRTKALALLEEAQAVDGLKPFVVTHSHNYGSSSYIAWNKEMPDEDDAEKVLDAEYEPDKDESLTIEENLTLSEMVGVAMSSRIPDIS